MQGMRAQLEKLESDASHCARIALFATEQTKKELYDRLAQHYRVLATEVQKASTRPVTDGSARPSLSPSTQERTRPAKSRAPERRRLSSDQSAAPAARHRASTKKKNSGPLWPVFKGIPQSARLGSAGLVPGVARESGNSRRRLTPSLSSLRITLPESCPSIRRREPKLSSATVRTSGPSASSQSSTRWLSSRCQRTFSLPRGVASGPYFERVPRELVDGEAERHGLAAFENEVGPLNEKA